MLLNNTLCTLFVEVVRRGVHSYKIFTFVVLIKMLDNMHKLTWNIGNPVIMHQIRNTTSNFDSIF